MIFSCFALAVLAPLCGYFKMLVGPCLTPVICFFMGGLIDETEYWRKVHRETPDDLAAVNYPSLPRAFNRLVDDIFRAALLPIMEGLTPGLALEVGCGRGRWLRTLGDRGWKTVGIDISRDAAARVVGSATRLPMKGQQFDLVLAVTVLQHLGDKQIALDEIARVLRPGGALLMVEVLDKPGLAWQEHVMPETLESWRNLLSSRSLTIEIEKPVEYLPILRLIENLRSTTSRGPRKISTSPPSVMKTIAWMAIACASRPLEPIARMIAPDSASHRLFLCRK